MARHLHQTWSGLRCLRGDIRKKLGQPQQASCAWLAGGSIPRTCSLANPRLAGLRAKQASRCDMLLHITTQQSTCVCLTPTTTTRRQMPDTLGCWPLQELCEVVNPDQDCNSMSKHPRSAHQVSMHVSVVFLLLCQCFLACRDAILPRFVFPKQEKTAQMLC